MGYSIVDVTALEGAGPGGAVRFVRRALGVEAFGINWFDLPPNSEGREHDETGTGQEEVNIIVRGSGVFRIDGEEVPFEAPAAFRFDPETVPRRADDDRRRRPPRQLRAARPVLMVARLVLWSLADSDADVESLRVYLRDESVDAFSEIEGLLFKAWISDANSDPGARSTSSSRGKPPNSRCRRAPGS
jgi:hypothetical protein